MFKQQPVQCQSKNCGAYSFCNHAYPHAERKNCYNNKPNKRMTQGPRSHTVCPECHPVPKE
jgi:hypothetical protein